MMQYVNLFVCLILNDMLILESKFGIWHYYGAVRNLSHGKSLLLSSLSGLLILHTIVKDLQV